jgi:vancomycin permeability regulator SanA
MNNIPRSRRRSASMVRARRPRRLRRYGCTLPILGALAALCLVGVGLGYVALTTQNRRYNDAAQMPVKPVAIVFGAGVYQGRPTFMLADRIRGAAELYHAGRISKILMTGDNSHVDYNEVSVMREYAMELGVPGDAITLDYAGFRTYDSCYRAREIFGVTEATLVTQHYHLARALYTCRQLGIDAVGLGTPDWTRDTERLHYGYKPGETTRYSIREVLATIKALIELHITCPLPTFLGPYEGMNG